MAEPVNVSVQSFTSNEQRIFHVYESSQHNEGRKPDITWGKPRIIVSDDQRQVNNPAQFVGNLIMTATVLPLHSNVYSVIFSINYIAIYK